MKYQLTKYRTNGEVAQWQLSDKPDLYTLQGEVSGFIEVVPLRFRSGLLKTYEHSSHAEVYCNEEGKMRGLKVNPFIETNGYDYIVGDILVVEKIS